MHLHPVRVETQRASSLRGAPLDQLEDIDGAPHRDSVPELHRLREVPGLHACPPRRLADGNRPRGAGMEASLARHLLQLGSFTPGR